MNHPGQQRRSREDPGVVAHHGMFEPVTTPVTGGFAHMSARVGTAQVELRFEGSGEVIAGSLERFRLELRCDQNLPAGARLGFARRWPSDWGSPQWENPQAPDYVSFSTPVGTGMRWWNTRLHPWHPFDHILLVELLHDHPAGQPIHASFGDARWGSSGFSVQTFIEEASPLSVRLLAHPQGIWHEVGRPTVRVVGADPSRLVLTLPSQAIAQQNLSAHLRCEDQWGNPAVLTGPIHIVGEAGSPIIDTPVFLPPEAWLRFDLRLPHSGWWRLQARAGERFSCLSNPIWVGAETTNTPIPLAWGDLHAQSVIGCGARTIDQYFAHARDFTAGDFSSHQANCFLVSSHEWQQTQLSTHNAQRPGQFITLLGVEWSGASRVGGDHNLYFSGDDAPLRRCSHEFVDDKSDLHTDLPHIQDVFNHYRDSDVLIAAHVGGRTADLQYHDASLERLIEVHSTHATSEWFWFEALRRKRRVGVIAGSDSVDGRPGGSHPGQMGVRNVRGGLTAVALPQLSRRALLEALRARRCYATSGARIVLQWRSDEASMGDEVQWPSAGTHTQPVFELSVAGTAPIEAIDFFRDDTLIETHDCYTLADAHSRRLRVSWMGASAPGNWQRARMTWDGRLALRAARANRVEPWAFDTPAEGIRHSNDTEVSWRSITAGDWDGVILDIEDYDPGAAELHFASEPLSFSCRLDVIGKAGWRLDLDDPSRSVQLRWIPIGPTPRELQLKFKAPAPDSDSHAYWVRIRQSDGEIAWSSPIFIQYGA